MIYNVAQLMKSLVGTSYTAAIHEEHVKFDDDLNVIGPIDGQVRMRRVNQGLLVDGSVDLTLGFTCVRCLKDFERPMHITFDERFYPTVDVVTGMPTKPFEEEDVFFIDEHHQVDLTEAIRQRILLTVPMVTLCKEDCAGLCSQCGHDLNLGACDCKPEEVETRFSILKDLLPNQSQL